MVAPDETTFAYLEGRPFVPRGREFQEAIGPLEIADHGLMARNST